MLVLFFFLLDDFCVDESDDMESSLEEFDAPDVSLAEPVDGVELLVLDGDVLDIEPLVEPEPFMPLEELLEGEVVCVVVSVFGAALFLLWLPRANADPLARAMMDDAMKTGASLRMGPPGWPCWGKVMLPI